MYAKRKQGALGFAAISVLAGMPGIFPTRASSQEESTPRVDTSVLLTRSEGVSAERMEAAEAKRARRRARNLKAVL